MAGRPNSNVRIWNVQDRRKSPDYRLRPWVARWRVGERRFQRAFRTRAEADHLRSELLVAQRNGERFDSSTGQPSSWTAVGDVGCHEWVRRWLAEQWDEWQPRTRNSAVEEMSRFLPLLVKPEAPSEPQLRRYLVDALRPSATQDRRMERWMDRWCYTLSQLDRSVLAEVDRQLGVGLDGQLLSQITARRYRRSARTCIGRAVDLELVARNPWPPAVRGASNRKVRRTSKAIDIKRLPDPTTMGRALDAIISHQPASRRYHVMTSVIAHAGLRPSEVIMLRPRALHLPDEDWGTIDVVEADISFDEPGDPKTGKRSVPIPGDLVALLRNWIDEHSFREGDLIFRTRNGNRPSSGNWARAWHRALRSIGHEPLRLYDCRHTAATTWLSAGVPLGEVARRMGHSVETLVQVYVGALRGDEAAANNLIDAYRTTDGQAAEFGSHPE
jgi:integrase